MSGNNVYIAKNNIGISTYLSVLGNSTLNVPLSLHFILNMSTNTVNYRPSQLQNVLTQLSAKDGHTVQHD